MSSLDYFSASSGVFIRVTSPTPLIGVLYALEYFSFVRDSNYATFLAKNCRTKVDSGSWSTWGPISSVDIISFMRPEVSFIIEIKVSVPVLATLPSVDFTNLTSTPLSLPAAVYGNVMARSFFSTIFPTINPDILDWSSNVAAKLLEGILPDFIERPISAFWTDTKDLIDFIRSYTTYRALHFAHGLYITKFTQHPTILAEYLKQRG